MNAGRGMRIDPN